MPTISEYCFITSAGLGPRKKYISKIPPMLRNVIAGVGCNITSETSQYSDACPSNILYLSPNMNENDSVTHCITHSITVEKENSMRFTRIFNHQIKWMRSVQICLNSKRMVFNRKISSKKEK